MVKADATVMGDAVRAGSVVTWHRINLHGEYDFSGEKLQDSVGFCRKFEMRTSNNITFCYLRDQSINCSAGV
jgi:hypothetical protein